MRKIITIIIFISIIIFIVPLSLATESTPSADVKAKLEELKKEIASKAAKFKQEVNRKLKDKAYIGKLKSKSSDTLTLATRTGPKIVNINEDTVFERNFKGKSKFSAKTIAEEDYLAALGDVDENGVLTAKKVILLPTTNYQLKTHLWGQIIAISDKLITVKDKNLKNFAVSIQDQSLVRLNDFTILTGLIGKNDIFEAEFVYVLKKGGILKSKKIATPSAKIASPSARPKGVKP